MDKGIQKIPFCQDRKFIIWRRQIWKVYWKSSEARANLPEFCNMRSHFRLWWRRWDGDIWSTYVCAHGHWINMGSGIITTTNSHKCPLHLWTNTWWHQAGWPKLNAEPTIYIQGICKPDWYYGRMSWSISSEFWVAVICLANTSRRCAPLHVTQKQIQDYLNAFCFRIFHQCHE
jgi:hypothetical protein